MDIERLGYPSSFEQASSIEDILPNLVSANIPGVFRGGSAQLDMPSVEAVLDSISEVDVPIAVTPFGNADAPVGLYFAKPHVVHRSVQWLLQKLQGRTEKKYYMQSQDDNLSQLSEAGCPLPRQLRGVSNIGLTPSAANLWIGAEGTTSRLHNDNYDNIYVQLGGHKRIWLIPPGNVHALSEKFLTPATYNADMELIPDDGDAPSVLFPTLDPRNPTTHNPVFQKHAAVGFVDIGPTDVLFLPALWYHQIDIIEPGINVSVNYWHEPFCGDVRWAAWDFARRASLIARGETSDPSYFYASEDEDDPAHT